MQQVNRNKANLIAISRIQYVNMIILSEPN